MSPVMLLTVSAIAAYLVGSVPFSLLIAKFFGGVDLREHGSGNVGATNVARTMGAKWGIAALLCDAAKGMVSVGVIPLVISMSAEYQIHQGVLGAILAVLGHMFPVWLKFRGGKGVATALGAVIILAPWITLYAFISFVFVVFATRIISLASMVAAVTFSIAQLTISGKELWTGYAWSLGVFSVAVPLLIIFQHRANIGRLLRGEESKLSLGKKSSSEEAQPDDSSNSN
jgi:acyl phosphate:glycerol-3-phosphate acyltransferase